MFLEDIKRNQQSELTAETVVVTYSCGCYTQFCMRNFKPISPNTGT